jgi:hypothetical protein
MIMRRTRTEVEVRIVDIELMLTCARAQFEVVNSCFPEGPEVILDSIAARIGRLIARREYLEARRQELLSSEYA